jgi:hypothetical protein
MGQLFETEKKPITETDRKRLAGELATADRTLIALKGEKGNVSRAYRVRIRELEEKVDTLSRQLDDGVVELKFEVNEVPDDASQSIQIWRLDTNERITSRPMNEAEKEASRKRRQLELPLDGKGKHTNGTTARESSMRPTARGKRAAKPGGSAAKPGGSVAKEKVSKEKRA